MKTFYLIIVYLCLVFTLQAQVSKTVHVVAPGSLSALLTYDEKNTITDFTLTGSIDVRDFWILSYDMPVLAHLDIGGVTVIGYLNPEGEKFAPNEIPANSFYAMDEEGRVIYQTHLISVVLPASITSIARMAFSGCSALTSINIPSKVTSIKDRALARCTALTSIVIPAAVSLIEWGAFMGCNAPITVEAANKNYSDIDGVLFNKDQTEMVYYPASKQGDYTMPASVKSTQGFYHCTGLTSIHLSPSITSLSLDWFTGCTNLSEIYIPSSVIDINYNNYITDTKEYFIVDPGNPKYSSEEGILFSKSRDVLLKYPVTRQGSYTIPSTVTTIKAGAFARCTGLTSVSIPAGVDTIESGVFAECSHLNSVNIPDVVTDIGIWAFSGCSSLTTINIPAQVKWIHSGAFNNCTGLRSIYCYGAQPPYNSGYGESYTDPFANVDTTLCILYVPYDRKELYRTVYNWFAFKNIVEMPGFVLSAASATIALSEGSKATVDIMANVAWNASSDQSWLTLSQSSGKDNQTITFTARENKLSFSREAIVTFSAANVASQSFSVRQEGLPKTMEVTAGGLLSALTEEELKGMMNLTLMGMMDARDFRIMRDSMPVLTTVDLSGVTIVAYSGTEGTASAYENISDYPANEIPSIAFFEKSTLTTVTLPNSATSIGIDAFAYCSELTTINIPLSVITIRDAAFNYCTKLTSLHLPEQLATIGGGAFAQCSNLVTVNIPLSVKNIAGGAFSGCSALTSITIPPSVTSINNFTFEGCGGLTSVSIPSSVTSIGEGAFNGCWQLTAITIPSSVTSIGRRSFNACPGLTFITIPSSVTSIGDEAFSNCSGLASITANAGIPVNLNAVWDVFTGVNTASCKLIVPYHSKELYAAAMQWKAFKNIEEAISGFSIDVNLLEIDAAEHSYTFVISANVHWTVSADQPWITLDILSGDGDQRITMTVEANTSITTRRGRITVSAPAVTSQIITVNQEGVPATLTISAGGLASSLTGEELKEIRSLTLQGTIDARDFKVFRDKMPMLVTVDLSRTTIVAYTGKDGTCNDPLKAVIEYPANEIPAWAFGHYFDTFLSEKLKTIILPLSLKSIGENAFRDCLGLTSIDIPEGVTDIKGGAFIECIALKNIAIPSSVTTIGTDALSYCKSLETVELPSSLTFINERLFKSCEQLSTITIPVSVTEIKASAFARCSGLVSVTIPASLSKIDSNAFYWCTALQRIYSHSTTPVILKDYSYVFTGVDKTLCKLYVPAGSKQLYANANEWKEFVNIIEMTTGTEGLEQDLASFICYPNPFTQQMSIEIANPSLKEVNIDIYSISGQKIRSLARAQKGAKITLSWDGTDGQGQKVPAGIYLIKMNEKTRKVVRE